MAIDIPTTEITVVDVRMNPIEEQTLAAIELFQIQERILMLQEEITKILLRELTQTKILDKEVPHQEITTLQEATRTEATMHQEIIPAEVMMLQDLLEETTTVEVVFPVEEVAVDEEDNLELYLKY